MICRYNTDMENLMRCNLKNIIVTVYRKFRTPSHCWTLNHSPKEMHGTHAFTLYSLICKSVAFYSYIFGPIRLYYRL